MTDRLRAWLVAIAAFAMLVAVLVTAAPAAIQCGPHDRMIHVLGTKYREAVKADGTVSRERIMEIFVSGSGSWTVLVTDTDGLACIVAAGEDWQDVPHDLDGLDPRT